MQTQYNIGEAVRLWVNKVGPYNNPQETYNYYYLPFCRPKGRDKPGHKWGGLGEVLQGNELIDSQLDIKYRSKCSPLLRPESQRCAALMGGLPAAVICLRCTTVLCCMYHDMSRGCHRESACFSNLAHHLCR